GIGIEELIDHAGAGHGLLALREDHRRITSRHPALILWRHLRRLAGERVTASRSRRTSLLTEKPASVLSPDPTTVVVGRRLFRCDRSAAREAGGERARGLCAPRIRRRFVAITP